MSVIPCLLVRLAVYQEAFILAQEQGEAFGYGLLADAGGAVDVDEGRRGRCHWPAEDVVQWDLVAVVEGIWRCSWQCHGWDRRRGHEEG